MTEKERDLGRLWFELVWNQKRREAISEILASDAVLHEAGTDTVGPEGFYPFFERMCGSFSQLHVSVHDTFAEGEKLCVRWSCTGKHTGDGLGIAPNGAHIHVTGLSILRIAGGRIVEGWQNWDMLGMMGQIQDFGKSAMYVASVCQT